MKKSLHILLALVMALSMTGCGQTQKPGENSGSQPAGPSSAGANAIESQFGTLPADGPEIQLVLASDAVEGAVHSQAAYHFAELIEKESQGKITMTYYPNAQLGSDTEILNSCVTGDIDMDLMSGGLAQSIIPESCMFNIPFLNNAKDLDAIIKTMTEGEFRDAFDACYEKAGLKLVVLSLGQSFELSTRKPVNTVDDIAGLKLRTVPGESYMAIWEALGANPTPLAYSELYTALQQGVVDGHDQMLSNILSVKFYEQANYVIMTNHNFGSFTIVMNLEKYEALPEAYKEFLDQIGNYMSGYLSRSWQDSQAADRETLEGLGMVFVDLTDEQLVEIKEKGAEGIARVEAMVQNDDIIALYKSCLEANKQG